MKCKLVASFCSVAILVGTLFGATVYAKAPVKSAEPMTKREMASVEGKGNFPSGYCTWFVDQQVRKYWGKSKGTNWQGNAGEWYTNAKAAGAKVGKTAKEKSIIVLNEGGVGHVAWVKKISGNKITIEEMNYVGFNKASTRTIAKDYSKIKGYIYKF